MAEGQLDSDSFVDHLLSMVPELRRVYEEHLSENEELLPHVFLGDVTRFVITEFRKGRSDRGEPTLDTRVLDRILDLLERAMKSSDTRLRELVSVSFLENLDQAGRDYLGIKGLLGPALVKELAQYERQHNWPASL